jgi:hypothetical protein
MKAVRIASSTLLLVAILPVAGLAQGGITPLLTGPEALASGRDNLGAYITLEDNFDIFGVYRRGIGHSLDFGVRAGYTDITGGGFHFGGSLRYGLTPLSSGETDVPIALVGGLQLSFADNVNVISVPFGASIGVTLGADTRPVTLFGLPFLSVVRYGVDGAGSSTELEFGIELGSQISITQTLWGIADLVISSFDDDNISLALGVSWRR